MRPPRWSSCQPIFFPRLGWSIGEPCIPSSVSASRCNSARVPMAKSRALSTEGAEIAHVRANERGLCCCRLAMLPMKTPYCRLPQPVQLYPRSKAFRTWWFWRRKVCIRSHRGVVMSGCRRTVHLRLSLEVTSVCYPAEQHKRVQARGAREDGAPAQSDENRARGFGGVVGFRWTWPPQDPPGFFPRQQHGWEHCDRNARDGG